MKINNPVSEEIFDEIKQRQKDEESSADVAKEFGITLVHVNHIFTSQSYAQYAPEGSKHQTASVSIDISPARSEYFRGLIEKKEIENENLKEMRDYLADEIKLLRKAIVFLQARRDELSRGVADMEKVIAKGILVIDHIEQ